MVKKIPVLQKIYALFISEWFMLISIAGLAVCIMLGIFLYTDPGINVAPSMDTISFSRWAYILGLPNNIVYGGIIVCSGLYWLAMLIRVFPLRNNERKTTQYLREQFEFQSDLELSAHAMHKSFIKQGFHVQEQQTGDEISFTAEKHRIHRWAGMIIHGGIVILLVGLCVYGLRGMREDIYLISGTDEQLYTRPQILNLNDVQSSLYPDTQALAGFGVQLISTNLTTHVSSIVNIIGGKPAVFDTIKYHVLDFGKTLKDALVEMRFRGYRDRTRRFRLKFGKDELISGNSLVMRLEKFMPDFIVHDGKVTSRSDEWENPAVKVSVFSGRSLKFSQWLFKKYAVNEYLKNNRTLNLELLELNEGKYLNMRMSTSPGILGVWSGLFLIGAGVALKYFLSYQIIWVLIQGKTSYTMITIAGESAPEHIHFPQYFKRVVTDLKNTYKPAHE
ncbi:MAG: cytochrome c biogenesis protein ResB [bacterium]